jgi:transcriptional regulator GlxA family with amidase domain
MPLDEELAGSVCLGGAKLAPGAKLTHSGKASEDVISEEKIEDNRSGRIMSRNICFFLYDQTNFLTLGCILEALSALDRVRPPDNLPSYNVTLSSYSGGKITGAYGVCVDTVSILEQAEMSSDTYIICGGWGFEAALGNPDLVQCVADQGRKARRLCAVGGGVFLAAAAGLLDGRHVAAHPSVARLLAERFPRLQVDSRSLLIRDGDILTSPGMSSSVDLALSLIEADYGYTAAVDVAKYLVLYLKRSFYDKQVSNDLILQGMSDKFGPLHDWIRSNLRKKLSLETLAEQAGMSTRNFTRVYQRQMGLSPRKAVEVFRVHAACRALTLGRDQIPVVALHCGFDSERTLLRAFTRIIGISPSQFREAARRQDATGELADQLDPHNVDVNDLLVRAAAHSSPALEAAIQ